MRKSTKKNETKKTVKRTAKLVTLDGKDVFKEAEKEAKKATKKAKANKETKKAKVREVAKFTLPAELFCGFRNSGVLRIQGGMITAISNGVSVSAEAGSGKTNTNTKISAEMISAARSGIEFTAMSDGSLRFGDRSTRGISDEDAEAFAESYKRPNAGANIITAASKLKDAIINIGGDVKAIVNGSVIVISEA